MKSSLHTDYAPGTMNTLLSLCRNSGVGISKHHFKIRKPMLTRAKSFVPSHTVNKW